MGPVYQQKSVVTIRKIEGRSIVAGEEDVRLVEAVVVIVRNDFERSELDALCMDDVPKAIVDLSGRWGEREGGGVLALRAKTKWPTLRYGFGDVEFVGRVIRRPQLKAVDGNLAVEWCVQSEMTIGAFVWLAEHLGDEVDMSAESPPTPIEEAMKNG